MAKIILVAWIKVCAAHWNVDPALALAVANVESRIGAQEFRVGRIGKSFYGPFGIHKCFKRKWHIEEWPVNVWVGCMSLRGIWTEKRAKKRLKRYNAEFDRGYWLAVKRAWRKYKEEGQ